jgi:FkbM family methyltransferase
VSRAARNSLLLDPDFAASGPGATLVAAPLGFVDVGARDGVHALVEPVAAATAVLGFEPAADECARLRRELAAANPWARCEIEPVALAARAGRARLHVLSAPTNSSLREPNEAFTRRYGMSKWLPVEQTSVSVTTLDHVLYRRRNDERFWGELVKLDTQGTEHEILIGARRTLRERTLGVVCEVSFCELYRGQRLFSEVELLLRRHGFSFFGFLSLHHRSRRALDKRRTLARERVLYGDAVFLRDPLPGAPRAARAAAPASPAETERGVHVLFTLALLLDYADFALELAEAWADGAEAERIARLVRRRSAMPPGDTRRAALRLARRVAERPALANVEVGRFVDARRWCWDYDDVVAAGTRGAG